MQTRTRPGAPLRALWVVMLGLALAMGQFARAEAQGAPPDGFADLASKISPAVVDITTMSTIAAPTDQGPMVPPGSPFEQFFHDFMDQNGQNGQKSRPQRSEALGSGFVISADGYIVTNNHVIDGADDIQIQFFDGKTEKAKVVGVDKATDIALLKVKTDKPLPFVQFGDSGKMRVGDWVLAMGNPLGQGFSISAGIISAKGRTLNGTYDNFFQTDAAINRGNSGGPLFNMAGQVIGVNTAILSPNGGSIGIGFSMASNVVSKVVGELKDFGSVHRGWLGVRIQDVTPDMADALGLPKAAGAMVTDVPDGPAKQAGMKSGDVILKFDGSDVPDTRELVRKVANTAIGKTVPVVVFRDGKDQTLNVTLGKRAGNVDSTPPVSEGNGSPQAPQPQSTTILGMTVVPLTKDMRDQMGLGADLQGVVIKDVDGTSEAFTKGLRPGDIITEAGQQKVTSVQDLQDRIQAAKDAGHKSVLLLIRRNGEPRFVALTLK
ncbi:Do family serine endopeptidase [Solirhodobacter olei]|uniref:Do family serine endopeptidase n=1 Tax=Solirhodobacter olei TaxID=2493082 RepID=UPI000FDC2121|nr:Do family serine endopeptidase [Solirhodobacter olei]